MGIKEKLLQEGDLGSELKSLDNNVSQELEDGYYGAVDGITNTLDVLKANKGVDLEKERKLWDKISKLANQSKLGKYL